MSLYYDAASIIANSDKNDSSLKTRVYGAKNLKASPAQVYALVSEASKWNSVLNEVVERSALLAHERKLTPALAVLLVHDLLLAKKGIAAPAAHALRTSVERHKARLQAEFTKARLRRGCATVEALRQRLLSQPQSGQGADETEDGAPRCLHPRWVRINRLKSSLDAQLASTFAGFEQVADLKQILAADSVPPRRILHVDEHVPDLLALPHNADLTKSPAYRRGEIIFQDKASCFPAYMLDPVSVDGDIVDACAAPGNKTTHLAALVHSQGETEQHIWACERDKARTTILEKMTRIAGAENVTVQAGQDFLRLKPGQGPWDKVGALLLDPSCSGSGIIGREPAPSFVLPKENVVEERGSTKKRKRAGKAKQTPAPVESQSQTVAEIAPEDTAEEVPDDIKDEETRRARLESLAAFQTKIILHAFNFPSARKVVYSTCSIHDEENEGVVMAALTSSIAQQEGWRILERKDQVSGMRSWASRGRESACASGPKGRTVAEACIRCDKHNADGTQGFFVAAFVRTKDAQPEGEAHDAGDDGDDDWEGFGDDR